MKSFSGRRYSQDLTMKRKINGYLGGFSFVLVCLSLGYLYLFIVESHQTTRVTSSFGSENDASEGSRVERSIDAQKAQLATKEQEEANWKVISGNVTIHVGKVRNPHDYEYVLNNERMCDSFGEDGPRLLIYVESEVRNWDRRQAIRDTWGQLTIQRAINFRLVFLLGNTTDLTVENRVKVESFRYGDIVQESFPESFRNLALKSVMGLKWVRDFCSKANYVMKTDDDIFIHVPNLLSILKEDSSENRVSRDYVLCHRNRLRNIIREELISERHIPESYRKYLVRENELPGQFYPSYCAGFGYVSTSAAAEKLYLASVETPYFFIEDAFITGFCRQKAGVELRDMPGFTLKPPVSAKEGSCAFREGRATTQEMGPSEMRELWQEINTQGFFCPQVVGYIPNNGAKT